MSEHAPHYYAKLTDRPVPHPEDVAAENRLLRAATDSLIKRIEHTELALRVERAQSDTFQAQVRTLVQRELELLRMLAAKTA